MSCLGYGQTWQVVTGSRALGTTYYNTTGKPITVQLVCDISSVGNSATINVNGTTLYGNATSSATYPSVVMAVVPEGQYYILSGTGGPTLSAVRELG